MLVVAHGGFNRVLACLLMKKPLKDVLDIKQDNTCVNVADVTSRGKVKIFLLNCTEHLKKTIKRLYS